MRDLGKPSLQSFYMFLDWVFSLFKMDFDVYGYTISFMDIYLYTVLLGMLGYLLGRILLGLSED